MSPRPTLTPLARTMGSSGVLFLTLSSATPASSLFIIVPDVLSEAGTGALLAMALAGAIAVCLARVYAELSAAYPLAGGEYAITGRILGPGAGMAVLAMNLVNCLLAATVLSLGLADYLEPLRLPIGPRALAVLCLGVCAALAALRLRTNALVTGAFLLIELAAVALLSIMGFARPERSLAPLLFAPVKLAAGVLHATPATSIGIAATVALFAYDGYESAIYFGEELIGARRRIGPIILGAMGLILVSELAPLAAALTGTPDLARLLGSANPFLEFARTRGGAAFETALALAVAAAIFNAVLAMILMTARQLYAVARDGIFPEPLGAALGALGPEFQAPGRAAFAAALLSALLAFVSLKLLLVVTGAGVAGVYLSLCLARLAWRPQGRAAPSVEAAVAAVALAFVFAADLMDPETGRIGLLATAASALAGALWWRFALRRTGRFAWSGPPDFDA